MSTVEAIFKFLASYPAWAKLAMLAGLAFTVGVALLSPRAPIDVKAGTGNGPTTAERLIAFKILGVTSSGLPASASVRVTAIINGKTYVYPSLAGVDWLEVGPTMSSQSFMVPSAPRYEIRFEMDVKGGQRHVSQETTQVTSLPFTGDYRLYPTKVDSGGVSRSFAPGATVRFTLETTP